MRCGRDRRCQPEDPLLIAFSNPLDPETLDLSKIVVDPPVAGLEASLEPWGVVLDGAWAPEERYTVTVLPGVRDIYGQETGTTRTLVARMDGVGFGLELPRRRFVVLDPAEPPELRFSSVRHPSLRVTVWRAQPEGLGPLAPIPARSGPHPRAPLTPGERLASVIVPVEGDLEHVAQTAIDLSPWLPKGLGQLIVEVKPYPTPRDHDARLSWIGWVQRTQIGLTAFVDHDELTASATDLRDGSPLAGVTLSYTTLRGPEATTGPDGLGVLKLGSLPVQGLVARKGDDVVVLPAEPEGYSDEGWISRAQLQQQRWYIFDSQKLYRPGEIAHLRGWVRRLPWGEDLQLLRGVPELRWKATAPGGAVIAEGGATLSALGGFGFDLPLPEATALGRVAISLWVPGEEDFTASHTLQVEAFRKPEFEAAISASDLTLPARLPVFSLDARTYAGGALQAATVAWEVHTRAARFVPPGRSDYSFGTWAPWWEYTPPGERTSDSALLTATTDAEGRHRVGVRLPQQGVRQPMSLVASATVTDLSGQILRLSRATLIHPSARYVGMRAVQTFVQAGSPVEIDTLVVDHAGLALPRVAVSMSVRRLDAVGSGSGRVELATPLLTEQLEASQRFRFTPERGGSYLVSAVVADEDGRESRTDLRVWVGGQDASASPSTAVERLTPLADRRSWQPGETARIGVVSPFAGASGVLTLRAGDILETRTFQMTGTSATLEIPISERHIPDLTVAVDLVGARPRGDGTAPAQASATLTLQVPPLARTLGVRVRPALTELAPGGETA
ncbi:MAG: hypothetical protein IPK67_19770 [Planctomycetes bacterium]|nr:hypothetical protein [Planctomycetota bacterium]